MLERSSPSCVTHRSTCGFNYERRRRGKKKSVCRHSSMPLDIMFKPCLPVCVPVCVCVFLCVPVCEREREWEIARSSLRSQLLHLQNTALSPAGLIADMRLRPPLWARSLWPALLLLAAASVRADQLPPKERHYYIAAVEIDWNYAGNDSNRCETFFCVCKVT